MTTHDVLSNETVDNSENSPNQDQKSEKRRQKSPEHKQKVNKQETYLETIGMMNGLEPFSAKWRPFPYKFHVKKDERGEHLYLQELDNKVLIYISKQKIIDAIVTYWHEKCQHVTCKSTLLTKEAEACFKLWAGKQKIFEHEVLPVVQKSELDRYCYHRLHFDFKSEPASASEIPLFTELFKRVTNAQAVMAWLGSLFDPKSDRQQYLWIHGEGQNGKGCLGRILKKLLGPSAGWNTPQKENDKFWTNSILGKRLVLFGDCNNYKYVTSGDFKSLTGGDGIRVEIKSGPVSSVEIDAKFLFLSNDKPEISSSKADTRRAIFSKFEESRIDYGKDYEERLWLEVPVFISECVRVYKIVTANSRTIPVDEVELAILCAANEERFEVFCERWLEFGDFPNEGLLSGLELQGYFKSDGITYVHEQRKFLYYMERRYGVARKQVIIDGKKQWRYTNVKARNSAKVFP